MKEGDSHKYLGHETSAAAWHLRDNEDSFFVPLIHFFLFYLPCSELAKMGVTLAGHQKKILSSVQSQQTQATHVQV